MFLYLLLLPVVLARPSITLCMMVRDESAVIEETLINMLPYIDRYDITDTGSTDGTPGVIRAVMSRNNVPGTVYHTDWNGFGDHGSEVGSQTVMYSNCYGQADYLFKMDADDLVMGVLDWPQPMDKDGYDLLQRSGSGNSYVNLKLLSGTVRWRAFGPVHEYVSSSSAFTSALLEGDYYILSRRLSKRNDDDRKYERDALVLENALVSEPENARYQFYLAQSYRDAGLLEKSLSAYLKRATMKGWHEEKFYALYQAGKLKESLNYSIDEIHVQYLRAYESHPERAEPLYALSRLFRLAGRQATAYIYAHRAVGLLPHPYFLFVDRWMYSVGILDEICATAWYAHAYEEGLSACSKLPLTDRIRENLSYYLDDVLDIEVKL